MSINQLAAAISTLIVAAALLTGLYISGSPSEQRLQRFDERRVDDLSQLARSVQFYWEKKSRLPESLADLVDGRRLAELPVDPESGVAYEYAGSTESFVLCAKFSRPASTETPDFWKHPAGRACFEFPLDDVAPGTGRSSRGIISLL